MRLIECVPNVSEGRRAGVLSACREAIRATGTPVLDLSADPTHNRAVYTVAGDAAALHTAVLALVGRAVATIDLRDHKGGHPRIGAVDVIPFVPLGATLMADAVDLARAVGKDVADAFGIPVYLYEEAASSPERRRLENVRRGEFEGLAEKLLTAEWPPDFGPRIPHISAGACAIGARRLLIAFNVNLATSRLDVAKRIAAAVRESSGGFPFVKAMAVNFPHRGFVQVSMNLTNFEVTSMAEVFHAIEGEAARDGVAVIESEIVGLVPAAAFPPEGAASIKLRGTTDAPILEERLHANNLR